MKKLLKVVVVLVVLVVILAVAVVLSIDGIAKSAVEKGSNYALGVETTLDGADVGLTSGTFAMNGLTVRNPEGYATPHFLTLGTGATAVSLGTLREDVVRIPRLELATIDINLESREGKANYDVILDNLKRFESGEAEPEEPAESGTTFVIDSIDIRDITVHLDLLPMGGDLTKSDLRIDVIELENVGSDGSGVPMGELVGIVMKAIFVAIMEKGVDLPADLVASLESGLSELASLDELGVAVEGLGDAAKQLGSDLEKSAEDMGKALEGAAGDALKGVGGLLGGGSKKKDDTNDDSDEDF